MEARDYFNRGNEYFENKDYDRAVEEYMKALEMIMGPDEDGVMQEGAQEIGAEANAIFLRGILEEQF